MYVCTPVTQEECEFDQNNMSIYESDGDTIPLTPESFTAEADAVAEAEGVFAWLRPHGDNACEAFDASVNTTIKNKQKHRHERQFLYRSSRERRSRSVYTVFTQRTAKKPNLASIINGQEHSNSAYKFLRVVPQRVGIWEPAMGGIRKKSTSCLLLLRSVGRAQE